LNNPLTAILGYSQLLTSSGQVGPLALGYTEKLYKQAQRTHRIVQNLLSFARQHKPERVPVRVNAILEDTLALRDYDLRMSQIRVHLDLASDLPEAPADPHQLQQVFLNLINNAVDAILEKGAEGDLWVRTGVEGRQLFIEFTDSGPGVKDSSRVFDPFYTTKPVGKGTGLGLSICYGIITEHGGTVRVKNRPPRGASFRVELPLHRMGAKRPVAETDKPATARSGRILVVDGNESVLESVAGVLRSSEYLVETAKSLADARKLFASDGFDLVIADWQLAAQENGRNALDAPDRGMPGLGLRILWISSVAPDKEGKPASAAPGASIPQKPFQAADLLAAVDAELPRPVVTPLQN
jgi:two-component system NtrC family sensor kinase